MLKIVHLQKKYGKKLALKDFSYTFDNGIYGMLGANGAGKSTLMNLLTDNIKRDSGEILYDGREILEMGRHYREKIGYMPQQQGFYENFSPRMFLFYIARLKGIRKKDAKKQIEYLLDIVHLSHVADKKIDGFSGGMKQRVLLAQALLGDPKVLILDEPTAGLDPKERVNLRNYIHKLSEDKIILLATHVVTDVESIADRILIMKQGELAADDTPENLVHRIDGNNLEDVYMYFFEDERMRL
jgi:ABC-type multidrug transport system ATPase subunit